TFPLPSPASGACGRFHQLPILDVLGIRVNISQCRCVLMPPQASTINERASSVSHLKALSGRLRAWLQGVRPPARRTYAHAGIGARQGRDLTCEFERFMAVGERLERGLEALRDIQWEIRENEARYRDLLDNQADIILRRDADACLTFVN